MSVVTAAYNAAAFIEDTVRSALAQTVAPLEVIVVDDGSTDDTAERAERAGALVLRQANAGCAAARNHGIRHASGEWIALLDADDIWLPDKLARQLDAVAAVPHAHLVGCDFIRWTPGEPLPPSVLTGQEFRLAALTGEEAAPGIRRYPDAGNEMLDAGFFLLPSTVLMRRSRLEEIGLIRGELVLMEDVDTALRLLKGAELAVVHEPLVHYRQHAGNHSKNFVKLAEWFLRFVAIVEREPEQYPSAVPRKLVPIAQAHRVEIAQKHLETGDMPKARRAALRALAHRPAPREAALALASLLPAPVVRELRAVRRRGAR